MMLTQIHNHGDSGTFIGQVVKVAQVPIGAVHTSGIDFKCELPRTIYTFGVGYGVGLAAETYYLYNGFKVSLLIASTVPLNQVCDFRTSAVHKRQLTGLEAASNSGLAAIKQCSTQDFHDPIFKTKKNPGAIPGSLFLT